MKKKVLDVMGYLKLTRYETYHHTQSMNTLYWVLCVSGLLVSWDLFIQDTKQQQKTNTEQQQQRFKPYTFCVGKNQPHQI